MPKRIHRAEYVTGRARLAGMRPRSTELQFKGSVDVLVSQKGQSEFVALWPSGTPLVSMEGFKIEGDINYVMDLLCERFEVCEQPFKWELSLDRSPAKGPEIQARGVMSIIGRLY